MKIECGRDVSEPKTSGEAGDMLRTFSLIWYCMEQGMVRGFLYGALVGVCFWIIGALFGCVIGAAAGLVLGLIDGVVLAAMAKRQWRTEESVESLIREAARVMPWLTFITALIMCGVIAIAADTNASPHDRLTSLGTALLLGVVPAALAALAAWQSIQKIGDRHLKVLTGVD